MGATPHQLQGEITRLVGSVREGDRAALDRLLGLVYGELKGVAERQLHRERDGHTLRPTALVHEAYLKLVQGPPLELRDRAHFLAIAARAMRQVLVEYARRRSRVKRGGEWARTTLSHEPAGLEIRLDEVLALDDALSRLGEIDEQAREVVELRFFGGLSEEEAGEALGVTPRTVRRAWARARAWLYRELYQANP